MNPEESAVPIGERLREVRGARSQQEFADAMGVGYSTIRRYESGERLPDAEFMLALHAKESVDPTWLLTGRGPAGGLLPNLTRQYARLAEFTMSEDARKIRVEVAGTTHWVNPEDYRWVPVLDVRLSGGDGLPALFENIVAFNAYRKSWLLEWGLLEAVLSEATVNGSSMEPELRDGDKVLVNHSAEFVGGDIYALRQGEDLIVKYLQKLPGGRVQVISENSQAFPPYVIEPADFESRECEIVGRIELASRHRGRRPAPKQLDAEVREMLDLMVLELLDTRGLKVTPSRYRQLCELAYRLRLSSPEESPENAATKIVEDEARRLADETHG